MKDNGIVIWMFQKRSKVLIIFYAFI